MKFWVVFDKSASQTAVLGVTPNKEDATKVVQRRVKERIEFQKEMSKWNKENPPPFKGFVDWVRERDAFSQSLHPLSRDSCPPPVLYILETTLLDPSGEQVVK